MLRKDTMQSKGGPALLPTPDENAMVNPNNNGNNQQSGTPGPVRFYNASPAGGARPISIFELGDVKPVGEQGQKILEKERMEQEQRDGQQV